MVNHERGHQGSKPVLALAVIHISSNSRTAAAAAEAAANQDDNIDAGVDNRGRPNFWKERGDSLGGLGMKTSAAILLALRSPRKTTRTLMLQTIIENPRGNRARRSRGAGTERRRTTRTITGAARTEVGRYTRQGRVPPRRSTARKAKQVVERNTTKDSERRKENQVVARIPPEGHQAHQAPC